MIKPATSASIANLMKTQLKGNEQRSLHDKAKDGRLVNNNINFSLCKSIDRFLTGESDYLFNVEKTVEFLKNFPDGVISMGCGAILSKKNGILTYHRFVPIINSSISIHHVIKLDKNNELYKQAGLERNSEKLEKALANADFYETMGVDKRRTVAFENNFKKISISLLQETKNDINKINEVLEAKPSGPTEKVGKAK